MSELIKVPDVGGEGEVIEILVAVGDRVLYDPEDRAEVDLGGTDYVLLRERDIHAVAAERIEDAGAGLYL